MTAQEIVDALLSRPITPVRVRKLEKLCQRVSIPLEDVLVLLTDEQKAQVQGVNL